MLCAVIVMTRGGVECHYYLPKGEFFFTLLIFTPIENKILEYEKNRSPFFFFTKCNVCRWVADTYDVCSETVSYTHLTLPTTPYV